MKQSLTIFQLLSKKYPLKYIDDQKDDIYDIQSSVQFLKKC